MSKQDVVEEGGGGVIEDFMGKKYQIIYADCPWRYNNQASKFRTSRGKIYTGGAINHYEIMSIEEIKELPIQKICENNALLFLWATFPCLEKQLEVFKSWGFKYRTIGFTWIKLDKSKNPSWGLGYYTRSNAEICLIGIRGKGLKLDRHDIHSVIISQKEKHSKKPDEVRSRIEKMYPTVSKIELFASKKVEGWDAIGYEIDGKDIREALSTIIGGNK